MEALKFVPALIISLIFFLAGSVKLIKSYESLNDRMKWTQEKSVGFIRFIALAEILGAIGFMVPYYTNFLPFLSYISAIGLIILMVGAPITHLKLGEQKEAGFTTLLLIVILIITFMRLLL